MGWLRLVGSLKLQVSFAKEPYKRDNILQERPSWSTSLSMGWLRLVGSLKLHVSFAKEPCKRDCILQKRPSWITSLSMGWLRWVGSLKSCVSFAEYGTFIGLFCKKRPLILRSLLIVATSYQIIWGQIKSCHAESYAHLCTNIYRYLYARMFVCIWMATKHLKAFLVYSCLFIHEFLHMCIWREQEKQSNILCGHQNTHKIRHLKACVLYSCMTIHTSHSTHVYIEKTGETEQCSLWASKYTQNKAFFSEGIHFILMHVYP